MFDTSLRVPLLVRWPAGIKPGTRVEQPVMNLDTFASLLGLTGVQPPAGVQQHGRDFSPLLRGESIADWRTEVFAQYDLHNAGLAFMRMVRTDEWKLVMYHMTNGGNELYNLKDDPEERRNRYYDKDAFTAREALRKKLLAWQQAINDPIVKLDANRPIEMGPPVGQ
jgi:uncharacterized sulfatase